MLCRRPAKLTLMPLAAVLLMLVLSFGLLYLRLLQGPISVGFLLAPVERGLKAELPGVSIDIGDAIVRLSEHGAIEFRLKDVRIDGSDGETLALAPLAAVQLSYRAILSGRIAATKIELIKPRILVSQDEEGRLSLSFASPSEQATAETQDAARTTASTPTRVVPAEAGTRRFVLARVLAETSARARRQEDAASFLETVGLRDAELVLDADGHSAVWQVLEFDLDLEHRQKRSIITGAGKIAGATGPWSFSFRTEDSEKSQTVRLDASVQDIVPHSLARSLPQLSVLTGIDVPVSGTGSIELTTAGETLHGQFALDLEPGRAFLPWLESGPLTVGSGRLDVRYSGEDQRFDILPSTLSWGKSNITLGGTIKPGAPIAGRSAIWEFDLKALGGTVAAEDLDVPPLPINRLLAKGRLGFDPGRIRFDAFLIDAGGAQVSMAGDIASVGGRLEAWLEGQLGPMSVASLKAMWPTAVAPRARAWAGLNLLKGDVKGGTFRVATSREAAALAGPKIPAAGERRRTLTIEAADLEIGHIRGLPPIEVPRALVRLEGNDAEISVPEASIATAQGRRIALKSGRFLATGIDSERPLAEIQLKGQAPLSAALDIAELEPISLSKEMGMPLSGFDGKVEGQLRVTSPLGDHVTAADMKIEAKLRISDVRAKNVMGNHDMHGATILIDATEKSIDIKGDMLIGGVSMKVSSQRLIGEPSTHAPPIKITASIDASDRTQLGLDLNHLVQGEIPVEAIMQRTGEEVQVQVIADLTGAELTLDDIAWRKPPGRAASLRFDAIKGAAHSTVLQNFKLIGDNIAIDGWVSLGPDHKAREYHFPTFSINVVTNMEAQGKLRSDHVWEVKAQGKTYDANDLFRSLIAFGQLGEKPLQRNRPGLDLTAEIDTVLGASDTSLRAVKIKMQKRAEQLTMLDLRGTLEGGKPLTARLRQERNQPRRVVAETPDAGGAMKLIGFYPNMLGGTAALEMNLDGRGNADRFGVLSIHSFRVLGDPVVTEVLQSADGSSTDAGRPGRRVVREQFDFDRLQANFSMGNGQLVLENAHVKGDVVGATLRGKLDYKTRRVQLGGTYVPLSGVNSSIAPIPLLGPLLTGPRGEGVVGMTFAIEGPMSQPQVIVNPLSLVMPGILREIFQMTPENPRITPRDERGAPRNGKAAGPQVRASPPANAEADEGRLGGWSAETTKPAGKVK